MRDRRTFRLYLAWFGPGLVKVGICAAERGNTRLLEQGALAFTWLAHGDHQLVRTAEQAVADSGVAVERQRRASKLPAWFSLGPPADYIAELRSAHAKAQAVSGWPDHLSREPFLPADHFEAFGLDAAPPPLSDVVAVGIGSVVAGRVAAVVGGELILDTPDGAVVVSGKRLAGWPVFPTTEPSTGYDTSPLNGSIHDDQPSLF